ncbi:MAG: alpha/beta fold hydrolase [Litorivicinus sp.]
MLVIEGDGFAFVTASRPSLNPTPLNPVGLRIATALDEAPGVSAAYVARPCQYVQDPGCRQDDWTDGRYTQSVVDRYQRFLAARFPDTPLVLVGYSGGGLIAAGLAQRDPRVIGLVTVAGNIDVNAWLAHHRLPAMNRAVDPAANAGRLVELPQVHLAGQRDRVVPPSMAESFARRSGIDPDQSVRLADASHGCCWEQVATAAVAEVLADIEKGRESN